MSHVVIDSLDAVEVMEEMFGPFITPEGEDEAIMYFQDFRKAMEAAESLNKDEPLNHFWAIIEAENEQWVLEGNHIVNRIGMWLVTTKPHNFEGNDFLWGRFEDSEEE